MTIDTRKSQIDISPNVLILGAGAAGLFCAITAAKRGCKVVVLEHNASVGEKIRISGGGRCNFTNLHSGPQNFLSDNPDFCRSALARYAPKDFISLVEGHGIPYFEKKDGQLFCEESAQRIIDMLLAECKAAGVEIRTGVKCGKVRKDTAFTVETTNGSYTSSALVVATGGLSIPKLGATNLGYRIAESFGLRIVEPRPGLVPFTLSKETNAAKLSGVSVRVSARVGDVVFEEMMLFTHKGLSGPAILQASSYWKPGEPVIIDLLPGKSVTELLASAGKKSIVSAFDRIWPRRFAEWWLDPAIAQRPCDQLSKKESATLEDRVHAWTVHPEGTEGFAKAEVTAGGVDTRDLSSKTMECLKVKGLYFIGEVVDVTGWLGGHNFQWAWSSGYAAGEAVAIRVLETD